MSLYQNPFPESDADRRAIWEMLVARDIEAFVQQDWNRVAGDFIADFFLAIDASRSIHPDNWHLSFPTLAHYRDSWVQGAVDSAKRNSQDSLREQVYAATTLTHIEIAGDLALAHKKFDGEIITDDGEHIRLLWQTVYQCRKMDGIWKMAGFVGYLPADAQIAALK